MKLLLENWRRFLDEAEISKMAAIDLEAKKEGYNEEYLEILNRFPEDFQREIIDERPDGTQEDIDELKNWKFVSPQPIKIPLTTLLRNEANREIITHTPKEVIDKINEKWNLDLEPGEVYDDTPERYSEYARLETEAAPSTMVDDEIYWGFARYIAALLRQDETLKVWKIAGMQKGRKYEATI